MALLHVLGWVLVCVVHLDATMMDMSHILNKNAIHGPGLIDFNLTLKINGTFLTAKPWFKLFDVRLSEHTGTHMDAPIHSYPSAIAIHELPKEQLVGPAVVFDVREQAKTDPDYGLKVSDIEDFENTHGRIPDGAIAFLNTGGSEFYNDPVRYFNTEDIGNFSTFHNPGFTVESANWLIKERKIKGLAADRISYDVGQPVILPVHEIIAKANVYGLENVANVHKIPVTGATVVVLPMAVEGGTGFPTRIMAFWGDNHELFFDSKSERARGSVMVLAIGLVLTAYNYI